MTLPLLFSLVSISALVASVLVVLLLRRQLHRILVDVCGGQHRADFWVAVSGIWIVLTGLLAGTATLGYWSADGSVDLFGGATSQLRLLFLGLLGAVLAIAAVLLYTIQQRSAASRAGWSNPPAPPATAPGDTRAAGAADPTR